MRVGLRPDAGRLRRRLVSRLEGPKKRTIVSHHGQNQERRANAKGSPQRLGDGIAQMAVPIASQALKGFEQSGCSNQKRPIEGPSTRVRKPEEQPDHRKGRESFEVRVMGHNRSVLQRRKCHKNDQGEG
jgi:hypothetical protein